MTEPMITAAAVTRVNASAEKLINPDLKVKSQAAFYGQRRSARNKLSWKHIVGDLVALHEHKV